jgi:hypothetical protein
MGDMPEAGTIDTARLREGLENPGPVFPPVVYVPCAPTQTADELTVDLRTTRGGQLALLVYSAMDRLAAHCGPHQPWTVMLTKDLEQLRETTGFTLILLDLDIPPELRRTAGAN